MKAQTRKATRAARRLAAVLLAVSAALLPAACGDVGRPFSKSDNPALAQNRPPAPPVRLAALGDIPPGPAARLRAALREAFRRRGMALAASSAARWSLRGDFEPFRDAGGRGLAYVFRLRNPAGRIVEEAAGRERSREGPGDPWSGVGPIAMTRIAETVAESVSGRLAQLGYGTQAAGLPPPAAALAKAGPGAERELDPDILAGVAPPAPATTGALRPARPAPGRAGKAPSRKPPGKNPEGKPAKRRIATVAVTGVRGAPGRGDAQLAAALRAALKRAGWPVRARPRKDSMRISGRVTMGAKTPAGQKVSLIWTVKGPSGRVLGVVRQANTVPSGSLDAGFGPSASVVAGAAAEGIFRLVRKLRR